PADVGVVRERLVAYCHWLEHARTIPDAWASYCGAVLNGRLYRVAFAPFLLALGLVAFSLGPRPAPLTTTLAPDAFEGAPAFAELERLAAEFPARRPGGSGDEALAHRIAATIQGLGGTAGGGFQVHLRHISAQTVAGSQRLTTVIALRPGSTSESAIAVVAHRDASQRGSTAELSATAALLELARVLASRETKRPVVLVSTSGGSGGDAGAADFAAHAAQLTHGSIDAAIVLGDLASTHVAGPVVVPYSDGYGAAPDQLARTLAGAVLHEAAIQPGAPSALGQFAHLAFGYAPGEQGPLLAAGIPATLVQVSGEAGPAPDAPVSAERLEGLGKATLDAIDALDVAPQLETAPQRGIVLAHQIVPAWALRLLIGVLLIPPLVVLVDGLARARRRLLPISRWVLWALTCALPFLACALFARALGALGWFPYAPALPVLPRDLPFAADGAIAVLACLLVLGLGWLAWPALLRALRLPVLPRASALDGPGLPADAPDLGDHAGRRRGAWRAGRGLGLRVGAGVGARVGTERAPSGPLAGAADAAGVAALSVLLVLAVLVWLVNPYAALLMLPALHLLLIGASPDWRPRPLAGLALLALALVPLLVLVAFYADQIGYGLGGLAQAVVLLLAGGHIGLPAAAAWSVALGCLVAMALVALSPPAEEPGGLPLERAEVSIRGPLSYAGPGSLGGTESALRR
ncbi:MAG TPA: M28 family peptidase, partial [Solirubrobacteraceae bacterium]|nr:M28 family peptidase [Solirubrobacteraceae bacterium]